jgi:hypothetical protein
MLLSPAAAFTTGNLAISEESTSVRAVGAVSISAPEAVTSTAVRSPLISSEKLVTTGTALTTLTVSFFGAKPWADTSTSYVLCGTLLKR